MGTMEPAISSKPIPAGLLAAAAASSVGAEVDRRPPGTGPAAWDRPRPGNPTGTAFPRNMRGSTLTLGGTKVRHPFNNGGGLVPAGGVSGHNGPNCGGVGTPIRHQLESRQGSCNELSPPEAPAPMQCGALAPDRDPNKCVQDGLGVGR